MNKNIGIGLIILVMVVIAGVVIGSKYIKSSDGDDLATEAQEHLNIPSSTDNSLLESPIDTQASPVSNTTTGSASAEITSVKEFTITGSNYKFDPSTITVNKGDKVKITFKNSGGFHDFVIADFNVKTQRIQGGNEASVEFTADKAGQFEYYCSVGNHRQMGMKGTLIVQ